MGLFTARERSELGKSVQTQSRVQARVQEQVRNSVRDDVAARRRPSEHDLAAHVGSPFERATATSLREINDLIAELQRRREELLSQSAHLQNEVTAYAKLNQAVMRSTEIIAARVANLYRAPDVHPPREPNIGKLSNEEERASSSDEFAQSAANQEAVFSPPEADGL